MIHMSTKSVNIHGLKPAHPDSERLVKIMTVISWAVLAIGVILCLTNITNFNTRNWGLMIGVGFLAGSVFIYTIGTAIALVHSRAMHQAAEESKKALEDV